MSDSYSYTPDPITSLASTFNLTYNSSNFTASANAYTLQLASTVLASITKNDSIYSSTNVPSGYNTNPVGLAFDSNGNLYTANANSDSGQYTITKITPSKVISYFYGPSTNLYNPTGIAIDSSDNVYVANHLSGLVVQITQSGVISTWFSGLSAPIGLAFDLSGNLYCSNASSPNEIVKITAQNTGTTFISFSSGSPYGMVFDSSYLYCAVSNGGSSNITIFDLTGTQKYQISCSGSPFGIALDSLGNVYWNGGSTINQIQNPLSLSPSTRAYVNDTSSGGSLGLTIDSNNNLFYTNYGNNYVSVVSTILKVVYNTVSASSLSEGTNVLTIHQNGSQFGESMNVVVNTTCFKEDTQILCENGYVKIQNIQLGDYVKIMGNMFKKVVKISNCQFNHDKNSSNNIMKLYRLSQSSYPELFNDLFITGGHSILVDSLTENERNETLKIWDYVHKVDDKFNLLTCLNDKAVMCEDNETVNIYHLVLENDDDNGLYGIWANGLLVESCSLNAMIVK